jgi:tetratricopeptide (TPR) repeat protein
VSFSARIINAVISYVAYLGKIFWPVNLAVFYPYQPSLPLWQVFGALVILVILTIAVIYTIKKTPFLFVGWFWYLGTLFPVIGLAQAGLQALADRFTYLPSIGILIMLVWGLLYLLPKEKVRKMVLLPTAVIFLAIFTILTWQQCGYWKNSVVLYTRALETTKNNDLAHYNLGMALKEQGKMEEALNEFRSAVKIIPDYVDAHNNIGIILEMYFKKYDEAIYHYRQALRSDDNNYGVHYNLGITLAKTGDLKEAIQHFRRAINLKPDFEDARRALRMTLEMDQKRR